MNRKERRNPSKSTQIKNLLNDMSDIQRYKDVIEGDWSIKEGDKVRLNLEVIRKHPNYERMLPAYRNFCEENAETVFTVSYDKGLKQSLVCFAEDTAEPKWLFWIGDLKKV